MGDIKLVRMCAYSRQSIYGTVYVSALMPETEDYCHTALVAIEGGGGRSSTCIPRWRNINMHGTACDKVSLTTYRNILPVDILLKVKNIKNKSNIIILRKNPYHNIENKCHFPIDE